MKSNWLTVSICFVIVLCGLACAEDGSQVWLRYAPLTERQVHRYGWLPANSAVLGKSAVLATAQNELTRGVRGMLRRELRTADTFPHEPAIVLATLADLKSENADLTTPSDLTRDSYWLTHKKLRGVDCLIVTSPNDRGVIHGVFALLRKISLGEDISTLNEVQQPFVPLRWVNQWDNLDGHIERGFGGASIFFENGKVRADLQRAADYA